MSNIYAHISPNFFDDLFLGIPKFFCRPIFFPIYLIKLLLPIIFYLFRPKKLFFRLYRPKNFINSTQHLFSLQIDEKNNIFFRLLIAKNCPSHHYIFTRGFKW